MVIFIVALNISLAQTPKFNLEIIDKTKDVSFIKNCLC